MRISTARLKSFTRRHWRIMLIGLILLSLTIAGYVVWSQQEWKRYEASYMNQRQEVVDALDVVAKTPSDTEKQRASLLTSLKSITTKAATPESDQLCTPHPLLYWQTSFDAASHRYDSCRAITAQVTNLSQKLSAVTTYLEEERSIMKAITIIPPLKGENAPTDWTAQMKAWSAAGVTLDSLKVGKSAQPLLKGARSYVREIETAWKNVIEAHEKKDRVAYESALEKLGVTYDTAEALKPLSGQAITELSSKVDVARLQLTR